MENKYADLFKVLGDPNRLEILRLLSQGDTCGCTIIDKINVTQPTLSYHLKLLTDAGLAIAYKEGTWKKHHVNFETIDELISFLTELKSSVTK